MFVKENTISAIKEYFFDSLVDLYPKTEIDSFFNILGEHYLGFSRSELVVKANENMSESELLKFHYAIKDLKKFKPVQYISGKQYFYDNEFVVNEHTLIPRPETEELVDLIVKENKGFNGRILDIGTGSGAIAISLDKAISQSNVTAFDVSKKALETAQNNNNELNAEVHFEIQDILNSTYSGEPFDIIVSNPPYVLNSEKELIQSNVLDHEPHIALFVKDSDPLLFYKAIVDFCKVNLNKDGKLYFEINEKYGVETIELLEKNNYKELELINDMQGKNRIVKGIKK